jgi:hypothetical protein
MHFHIAFKPGTVVTSRGHNNTTFAIFLPVLFLIIGCSSLLGQKTSEPIQPPEMLLTEQGFLAINTPKGWIRSEGPGLAYFIRKQDKAEKPPVWIYVSSAPIGPHEEAKNANVYIQSDIMAFRARFKGGTVREEKPLNLPKTNTRTAVYTFRSGEKRNSVEQVVYIEEVNRVLTLVLSARETPAFEQSLSAFRDFVESYGGSIVPTANSK